MFARDILYFYKVTPPGIRESINKRAWESTSSNTSYGFQNAYLGCGGMTPFIGELVITLALIAMRRPTSIRVFYTGGE